MTDFEWIAEVQDRLERFGYSMDDLGFRQDDQPWFHWKRLGLSPRNAVGEAFADQCIDPQTGKYDARAHAECDASWDDD